jgi:endonuclease/exonuclease/phosphatase family metal-dependent hydrolase
MAELRLPNGQPLIVHSAHLRPGAEPEIHQREISTMLRSMKADLEAGRSMLLIGDLSPVYTFNRVPRTKKPAHY